jgi:regulator of protease activity HflC (stomatin/prohibitin superfamily)
MDFQPEQFTILSIAILVFAIVLIARSMVKISPSEKGVKERLSQYAGTLGSGWHFLIPFIDSVRKVDMRERVINTSSQEMITQDNAVVTVDAVIFAQIITPEKTVYEIQDPFGAISNLSITTLRSIIGTMTLDEVLGERSKINTKVQTELSHETSKWGLSINKIEIQRIDPPNELMQAMNQQKIAQQTKRAQILEAEGLKEAAIRKAEGVQQQQILEADGEAAAIERIASARAKALQLESEAAMTYFKDNAVLKEQLATLQVALKDNTKYIIGNDVLDLMKKLLPGK